MSDKEDLMKKLYVFVYYFVRNFDYFMDEFRKILENELDILERPISTKSRKALTGATTVASAVPGHFGNPIKSVINLFGKYFKKYEAKTVSSKFSKQIFDEKNVETRKANREVLVKAAVDIFQSFEMQFLNMSTEYGGPKRALQKLAENSVVRIISCYLDSKEEDLINLSFMTKAVVNNTVEAPSRNVNIALTSKKEIKTTDLFTKVGIVIEEKSTFYFNTPSSETNLYGYRRLFSCEDNLVPGRKPETNKCTEYIYVINKINFENIVEEVLEHINKNDPDQLFLEARLKKNIDKNKHEIIEQMGKYKNDMIISIDKRFEYMFNEMRNMCMDMLTTLSEIYLPYCPPQFCVQKTIDTYTGRNIELETMHDILSSNNCLVICGLPGIGKSELVRQYAHVYNYEYKHKIWMDVNCTNIDQQFMLLAKELVLRAETFKKFMLPKEAIFSALNNEKNLIVLDCADNLQDMQNYYPPKEYQNIKMIITVNNRNLNNMACLQLTELTIQDSIAFLKKSLNRNQVQYTDIDLQNLSETMHCFPLALQIAAAHINEEIITVSECLNKFDLLFHERSC